MLATLYHALRRDELRRLKVDERGGAALRKQLKRDQVAPFFARLEPCLISDRHRSLRRSALLGSQAHRARASREDDGAAVRQALRQDQQE